MRVDGAAGGAGGSRAAGTDRLHGLGASAAAHGSELRAYTAEASRERGGTAAMAVPVPHGQEDPAHGGLHPKAAADRSPAFTSPPGPDMDSQHDQVRCTLCHNSGVM